MASRSGVSTGHRRRSPTSRSFSRLRLRPSVFLPIVPASVPPRSCRQMTQCSCSSIVPAFEAWRGLQIKNLVLLISHLLAVACRMWFSDACACACASAKADTCSSQIPARAASSRGQTDLVDAADTFNLSRQAAPTHTLPQPFSREHTPFLSACVSLSVSLLPPPQL